MCNCDKLRDLLDGISLKKKPNLDHLGLQRILLEVWERGKMVTFVLNENFKVVFSKILVLLFCFWLLILVLYNGLHFISINLSECLWYKYKKIEVKARPLFFCASYSQEVYWIFWFFIKGIFFVYYVFGIGVWPFCSLG